MVKTFAGKLVFVLGGLSALTVCCYGDTMTIASSASETSNNSGYATVAILNSDPLWNTAFAGSSWVSFTQSGSPFAAGYVSVPNGTTVSFTDSFTINGAPTSGMLEVMADDTSSVTINGTTIMAQASAAGNTYRACSDYAIGCLPSTVAAMDLTNYLEPGANVLTFDVTQVNAEAFGLDYSGTINYLSTSSAVPEPAEFGLIGLTLGAILLSRKARFKSKHRL